MNVLPGMQQAANAAGDVDFTTPEGWEKAPCKRHPQSESQSHRRHWQRPKITILTFPGDVGGRLANINRWRGQVGLEAATAEDLRDYTTDYDISGHRGTLRAS